MPAFQSLLAAGQKRPYESGSASFESRKRQSLRAVVNDVDGTIVATDPTKAGEQYWMVQWRAPQSKKHKTWDGDGVLVLSGGKGILHNIDGNIIASGKPNPDGACVGTVVFLGGKEMEVDCAVPRSDFTSGKVFGKGTFGLDLDDKDDKPMHASTTSLKKKFAIPLKPASVNSNRQQPQYPGSSRKKGIDLEPIGLLQKKGNTGKNESDDPPSYWSAHWRKPQGKKHKTWDGDAFIIFSDGKLTMVSDSGKLMGSIKWNGGQLKDGTTLNISSRTVELESQVRESDVPNIIGTVLPDGPTCEDVIDLEAPIVDETDFGNVLKPSLHTFASKGNFDLQKSSIISADSEGTQKKFVVPTNFYGKAAATTKTPGPLHDPMADGAVVMKAPTAEHQQKFNLKGRPVVPVVIDPILARHLRPHQKDGVKFMYECVMGLRKHEGQGCILADEMGMGKTLQTIALVWTLLKQNCYAGGSPAVGKALIVCPVSLVANWKKEFHKWLGRDRVGVFTGEKDKAQIKQFINSKIHQVLVIGYEKVRPIISELAYSIPPISLIICDEGHRLKSANNKTSAMFQALKTPRRIILSGTPIQNDLSEFHAMADFCNPGLLDSYSTFRKVFEMPILNSRAPGCSAKVREIGEARHGQLQTVAKSFVLRRDASILTNYLPPKHEYVVFVTPSSLQKTMFTKILQPETLSSLLRGSMARSLAMIHLLTKLSNSPVLLKAALEKRKDKSEADHEFFDDAMKLLPDNARPENVELSGKLDAISNLLGYLRKETEEKCILVSHYTSTLDVIGEFCKKRNYSFLRLDGQTPVPKRQEYVDRFNKAPQSGAFIFLLSAKAGGVGLNLIGASRLCLIDSDWNPSHDLQSMARIHRDGQKRPVFIYRFLTAGAIDEKIYQRQVTKLALSESLMGKGSSEGGRSTFDSFTHKELRDVFTFHQQTSCHTHELIGCPCLHDKEGVAKIGVDNMLSDIQLNSSAEESGDEEFPGQLGFRKASDHKLEDFKKIDKAFTKKKKAELASLGEWKHINCIDSTAKEKILDDALKSIVYEKQLFEFAHGDDGGQTLPNDVPGGSVCFLFEKSSESSS